MLYLFLLFFWGGRGVLVGWFSLVGFFGFGLGCFAFFFFALVSYLNIIIHGAFFTGLKLNRSNLLWNAVE